MGKIKKGLAVASFVTGASALYLYSAKNIIQKLAKIDSSYQKIKIIDLLKSEELQKVYLEKTKADIAWFKEAMPQKVKLTSFDGLKLCAYEVGHFKDRPYVILVHGYNSDALSLLNSAHEFYKRNYNLLMIDQRGWGESEGEICTFGFKESLDLVKWIEYLLKNTSNDIGLYGVSMGASTILKTLSYKLDPRVRFAILEGPYSSFRSLLEKRLKTSLLTPALSHYIYEVMGFELDELDLQKAVKENNVPTLFIHADKDSVVDISNTQDLFAANKGLKELYVLDSDVHAYGMLLKGYFERIDEFLDHYLF